ncbi:MAG TPA: tetratricopeptide repeat protein, partial [Chthoniobacterales bacterium]|nr:tetratricopeptide repeat protein [Chthoniobacterales bacterium]
KSIEVIARQIAEMVTVHNAATYLAEHEPWDFMAVYQGAIDHFSHAFMQFHPPRQEWINERSFGLYHDVVNSAYRYHDLMLGRMVELAGPDATILLVSDHGFHSGSGRTSGVLRVHAGPAFQHRSQGIFVMAGPGVRRDERIYGAGLLDIVPTLLALFGLPIGQDMEGRVLAEAFTAPPSINMISSWEEVPGDAGMQPISDIPMTPEDAATVLQQFVDLGYIDPPSPDKAKAVADAVREQKWNVARVHLSVGRIAEATPLLEDIVAASPQRGDFAATLAHCQARLGLIDEAQETIDAMLAEHRDLPAARAVLGQIARAQGRPAVALEHLLVAAAAPDAPADLHLAVARTYTALHRWDDAAQSYLRMIDADPTEGLAHQGLAFVQLRMRRWESAAASALSAISCQFYLPLSHYYLGCALVRLGIYDRAIQAFEVALAQNPPVWQAHRWLALLLAQTPGRESEAAPHRQALRSARQRRALADKEQQAQRESIRARFRARQQTHPTVSPTPPVKPETESATSAVASRRSAKPKVTPAEGQPLDLLLVSGLPRSGTSLMMQLLAAGGWPLLTDEKRPPDEDNPEGYYEWEFAKQLRNDPELIQHAKGKVLKAVSLLLPSLPARHHYRILFMLRPIEQIGESQARMIARRKGSAPPAGGSSSPLLDEKVAADSTLQRLRQHLDWTRQYLRDVKNITLLEIDYPALVTDPAPWLPKIAAFAGRPELSQEALAAMAQTIRPELHRRRGMGRRQS